MNDKKYSLLEVTESLRISPDTLYRWESQIPELKPSHLNGGRVYSSWEFDLLQQAHRLFHNYNQDFVGTRQALERWVSKNPRPQSPPVQTHGEQRRDQSPEVRDNLQDGLNPWSSAEVHSEEPPPRPEDQESFLKSAVSGEGGAHLTDEHGDDASSKVVDLTDPAASVEQPLGVEERPSAEFHDPHLGGDRAVESPKELAGGVVQADRGAQPARTGLTGPAPQLTRGESATSNGDQSRFPRPSVIEQGGGKSRQIGRTDEDLFSDLDSDPYDLSPRESGRPLDRDFYDFSTSSPTEPEVQVSPSYLDGPRREISLNKPEAHISVRRDPPSASDWLEEPSASPIRRADSKPAHQPTEIRRAFSEPEASSSLPSPSKSPLPNRLRYSAEEIGTSSRPLTPIPARQTQSEQGSSQRATAPTQTRSASGVAPTRIQDLQSAARRATSGLTSSSGVYDFPSSPSAPSHNSTSSSTPPLALGNQDDWQRAYHHAQAQLAKTKRELARAQDALNMQRQDNKRLERNLLTLREKILKEIYDLRDLVVDK